jgi:hypothetical protein
MSPLSLNRRSDFMKKGLTFVITLGISMTIGINCQAKQLSQKNHVYHSRVAPVLLHKAVPPFKGIHVYDRTMTKPASSTALPAKTK